MYLQWLLPGWAWLLLLAVAIGCALWARRAYARSEPPPPSGIHRLLVGLRVAVCILILTAAARPLLVHLQEVREPALVALVVEDSGSMALRDSPEGPSRWTRGLRLAAAVDSVLSLQGDGAALVHLRGNGRMPLREMTLQAALADTPRAVGTNLPGLVAQAHQSLLAQHLCALVVLNDGHSQDHASTAAAIGLPLWLVGVGDTTGPPDRFLADLRHPDRIQRGESLTIDVAVGLHGITEEQLGIAERRHETVAEAMSQPLTVRLLHDGKVVDTQTEPSADVTRLALTWTPEHAGLAILEVDVAPLDNERFLANNRATLAVDVLKDRSRILVLAPAPGWDVRFLAQAALKQTRWELSIVRPGPSGPVLALTGQTWRAPESVDAWCESWDAVVLVGPPGALLPDEGRLLAAAVQRGLGVFSLAGDHGIDVRPRPWPAAIQAILPVMLRGDQRRAKEWSIQAATDAVRHPILAGITHGAGSDDVLASWPPLRWVQVVSPRSQAEVLLHVGNDQPLLVVGTSGEGRSMWFGGRRLWELVFWRLPRASAGIKGVPAAGGSSGGGRLLEQMLLWTALGDQTAGITLLGQRLAYEEGEYLPVAVRWLDLRGEPVAGWPLAVEVARPDGSEDRIHALQADPLRSGVAVGELPPLPPGRWLMTPRNTEMPPQTGSPREIMVTPAKRELTQVRQDRRNLRQTAARLGGVALDAGRPQHVQRLLAELADLDLKPRHSLRQSRWEPAAGWTWLAIVVVLLAAEWFLRRRHGLL